ncbi:hypothetical protein BURPS668_1216 [Burkholderia pseudomallei 668]|nr:hypothetical protein BURPS668_1216 [Burkholderia pseudomallei 668]
MSRPPSLGAHRAPARARRAPRPGSASSAQPPLDAPPGAVPELPDGAIGAGCTPPVAPPVELEPEFESLCFEHEAAAIANPAVVTPTATARHMLRENSGRIAPPAVNESVAQQAACRVRRSRPAAQDARDDRRPARAAGDALVTAATHADHAAVAKRAVRGRGRRCCRRSRFFRFPRFGLPLFSRGSA